MADYYKLLNVDKNTSDADLKKAYRKMARKYHPDVSKEAGAEEKFKEVQIAYDVLKDAEKRKLYDQFGDQWQSAKQAKDQGYDPSAGAGHGFHGGGSRYYTSGDDDIFSQMFGRGQQRQPRKTKGQDLHASVQVSLEEAYMGCEQTFQVAVPGVDSEGYQTQTPKALKVKIPKGVTNGQQIRLAGQGAPGKNGGPHGDLYIKVTFKAHAHFTAEKADIYLTLPIAPWEAALGAKVKVPTLGGVIELSIPADSESGKKMRLKGRGLPAKTAGDQLCVLQIVTPKADTDEAKALYEKMANELNFDPRAILKAPEF
tara:strand:+ start:110694 stop:111632 length:939 start_codon:yes stop_codon:yes gene_type:complete